MRGYAEISTQEELDALFSRLAGFHDSMAKEAHLVNRGWIGEDRSMMMDHRFDARLLIQSQSEVAGIELLFIGVSKFETSNPGECRGARGKLIRKSAAVDRSEITIALDESLRITAERVFFVERPTWTGLKARFGTEVPRPESVSAAAVDEGWRQCSSCADAFEASPEETYAVCPSCNSLTELVSPAEAPTSATLEATKGKAS